MSLLQSPVATEKDPPAPGACPLPRPPTSWSCPQPPLPPFNHPSISGASSRCWESLSRAEGGGTSTAVPAPQTAGQGTPGGEGGKGAGNFPRSFQGRWERHPWSQILEAGASLPHTRYRGRDLKVALRPHPRRCGGGTQGTCACFPGAAASRKAPRTRPQGPTGSDGQPQPPTRSQRRRVSKPGARPTTLPEEARWSRPGRTGATLAAPGRGRRAAPGRGPATWGPPGGGRGRATC